MTLKTQIVIFCETTWEIPHHVAASHGGILWGHLCTQAHPRQATTPCLTPWPANFFIWTHSRKQTREYPENDFLYKIKHVNEIRRASLDFLLRRRQSRTHNHMRSIVTDRSEKFLFVRVICRFRLVKNKTDDNT